MSIADCDNNIAYCNIPQVANFWERKRSSLNEKDRLLRGQVGREAKELLALFGRESLHHGPAVFDVSIL
jgi:hypothetical protein